MPLITFQPSGKSVEAAPGTELLEVARRVDIPIAAPCGGKGTCGKCLALVVEGEVESDSLGALSKEAVAEGFVLACRTRIGQNPVTIEILGQLGRSQGRFVDTADNLKLLDPELLPQEADFSPLVVKHRTTVPAAALADGLSDLDRLTRQLQADLGKELTVDCPLPVLRNLAEALRAQEGRATATLARRGGRCQLVDIEPGNTAARHYGIALDIGTTTVALQLVYLPLEEIVCTLTDYNDQVDCGLDVISRINYGRKPERLEELRQRIVATVNRLVDRVLLSENVRRHEITSAVLSGNTTMTHLLLGLPSEAIRLEPYTPTVMGVPEFAAGELGIAIHPLARVVLSPAVGSYVGGDITAGLLCTSLATDNDDLCLFIDIGTNGEIAIGNRDFLLTCACSAGPAFEGGGIDCGMRAAAGAIDRVEVDPATGAPTLSVIGDGVPKGICGSGMISLIANLFRTGWLDAAGKLDRSRPSPHIQVEGRIARYLLAPAVEGSHGKPVSVNELDIDNLIRAKAAIYSAGAVMLGQVGMNFDDLRRIYIAGGFGRSLVIADAKTIGLIPDLPDDRFRYVGNSSLMGSYMMLISDKHRQRQQATASRMTYLDLSTEPGYMDEYTAALFLPHTDARRFPSAKRV